MAYVLGVTGTFGSGKTTVATILRREHGAAVIDADELAREATRPGAEALEEIRRAFGDRFLDREGRLRRRELGLHVFGDREATARLERIIHPRVRAEEERLLREWADRPLIVLDVPLLLEAGMGRMCDSVAVVVIGERERYGRLRARGFAEEEITRRLGMQMPQERKRAIADHVIENSGSIEETRHQVNQLMTHIKGVRSTPQ